MLCPDKRRYRSRLEAESALAVARHQWRRDPQRATEPPTRVYCCEDCGLWHLTSKERVLIPG